MLDLLLALWVTLMRMVGLYVALLLVLLSAAFALAGVWVVVEQSWVWAVRRIRRWRVAQEIDRHRAEQRVRATALTGSQGVPRRTWEAGEPPEGPKRVT